MTMSQHHHSHSHHEGHHHQVLESSGLKDPVCGMTVQPTTAHRVMHDGHEVVFCSARCKDKFVADPAKYTDAKPASVPAATAPDVTGEYTCPMHPEIVRDAPGSCPICGMALERRMPALDDDPDPELVDMTRRFW